MICGVLPGDGRDAGSTVTLPPHLPVDRWLLPDGKAMAAVACLARAATGEPAILHALHGKRHRQNL
jgi:hypothetical protein